MGMVGDMEKVEYMEMEVLMGRLTGRLMGVPMLKKNVVESMHGMGFYVNSDWCWLAFWVLDGL